MEAINPKLTFTVTLDEANKIFKALGALPFSEVYELIGKLNEQANHQLSSGNRTSTFIQDMTSEINNINS